MNRFPAFILFFGLSVMMTSCQLFQGKRKKQEVPARDSVLIDTATVGRIVTLDSGLATVDSLDATLWNMLLLRPAAINTFSGKGHLSYEGGGNSNEFDVNIRIERDRKIWVSITAILGMELARALITPDSLKAIDRMHHDAYLMSLADARQMLPFPADFSMIQALLLGEPLPAGATFAAVARVADTAYLFGNGSMGRQEIGFALKDSLMFRQDLTQDPDNIRVLNDRFENSGGFRFPRIREIQAQSGGQTHRMLLEFDEVRFNEELEMNFSIPSKYQRK